MKIVVLGAGVVGVTTAYFLAKSGHEVTVLEKNSSCALSCSYANGGQLSYSHIEPWSSKSSLLSIIKAAIKPSSFLEVSNVFNREFFTWSFEFLRNFNSKKSRQNSKNIFAISNHSRKMMEILMKGESELKFDYKNSGILHFFRDEKKFNAAIKEAEFHNSFGCKSKVLTKEECLQKEPTLVKLSDEDKLAGGIFYKYDASGNSFLFTQSLEKICHEKYGVTFEYNADIRNILTNHKKITGINTNKGVFVSDKYVSCLGAHGNSLLKGVGINTKIMPLKGHSLSIGACKSIIAPNISMTDPENRIVYSRVGNIFRAAGSVELGGNKASENMKLINFLKKTIRSSFSDYGNFNEMSQWFGFRPFRPNSTPLICEVKKYGNLYINAGHGSLGWTMSAGSADILANLVDGRKSKEFAFLESEGQRVCKGD